MKIINKTGGGGDMEKAKVIKIWPSTHVEVRIYVTRKMIEDFNKCCNLALKAMNEDEPALYFDCKKCSWRDIRIDGNGVCASLNKEIENQIGGLT